MYLKVLVDTNVIVAASINENVKELNLDVKHRFYDQSNNLFGIFRKRLSERIGIVTASIETESSYTLATALNSTLNEHVVDTKAKRKLFDQTVAIKNLCEDKMKKLIAVLLREPVSETDLMKNLPDVDHMCVDLKRAWEQKYATPQLREKESWERAKPMLNAPKWKGIDKQEIVSIQREQVERETKQLSRFMSKYPNLPDCKILAEAISIAQYYQKVMGNGRFYIASCDMGFFSPHRVQYGVPSDIVTSEIKNRFNIICDFPDKILPKI